jgi:hypothetical protein
MGREEIVKKHAPILDREGENIGWKGKQVWKNGARDNRIVVALQYSKSLVNISVVLFYSFLGLLQFFVLVFIGLIRLNFIYIRKQSWPNLRCYSGM